MAQNLKFTDHIQDHEDSMLKVLNSRVNALKKVSKSASFKSRKMIANGIIISRLIYLIPLWSGCQGYLMNSLQVVQNKAARLVTRCGQRTPVSTLLRQCGWLSVSQLSVYHSLLLVYKILSTKSPSYLHRKLSGAPDMKFYETRLVKKQNENQNILLDAESSADGDVALNSFKYRATKQWNNLPLEIRQARNMKQFKWKLRKWLSENGSIK